MIVDNGKYYLYRHIRLDKNEPFYIGVGTKNACKYCRAKTKLKRNKYWERIVAKTPYEIEILIESNDYQFIMEKEREFIALYKRRDLENGSLCNLTDGGEGSPNSTRVISDYQKMRISKALKGRKLPEWQIEHLRKTNTGRVKSKETNLKMSITMKGREFSEETREKISKAKKGKVTNKGNSSKNRKVKNNITGGEYRSIREAAMQNNINISTIRRMIFRDKCKEFKLI